MAKPWGRYEIGYLDGSKFRALHANAICLWWEIKSYCDAHLNDGRFPATIIKTFRFYSARAMEQLTSSCGVKPNNSAFAPLIETQAIGGVAYFLMHDYLDHNDCRETVLARMQDAEERQALRRQKNKERQHQFRRLRQEAIRHAAGHAPESVTESVTVTSCHAPVTRVTSTPTPTPTPTEEERTNTETKPPPKPPRSSAHGPLPGFPRLRVFRWMVEQLRASLGAVEFDLEGWFLSLERDATLVIPAEDKTRWAWLKSALDFELRTRGLLRSPESNEAAQLKALVAQGPSKRPYEVGK